MADKKAAQRRRIIKSTEKKTRALLRDMFKGKRSTEETSEAFEKLVNDAADKIKGLDGEKPKSEKSRAAAVADISEQPLGERDT